MGQQFSRAALHELVWSEPRTVLARRLGISDVALAKSCTRAHIPMPPRGYWARLAAGKQDRRVALPARALGQHDHVHVGSHDYRPMTDEEALILPPAPVFDETVDAVRARADALLARCHVPRSLRQPHWMIAALLTDDAERRKALETDRYAWPKPEFDTPQALHRVRIVNALFMVMAHAGAVASIGSKDLRTIGFRIGDTPITVKVQTIGAPARSTSHQRERLELVAEGWPMPVGIPAGWQDSDMLPVEERIPEIARDLLVMGEMTCRAGELQRYAWRVEHKESVERKLREERERLDREARERLLREEAARRRWLLKQAANLRKANEVRALVAAMDDRSPACCDTVEADAYGQWREWALREADILDPRRSPVRNVISRPKRGDEA